MHFSVIVMMFVKCRTVILDSAVSSLQLNLSMVAGLDDIKVSWGVSHLDTGELEVSPTFTQVRFDESGVRGQALAKVLRRKPKRVH